jgi:hypothetical protein
MRVLHCLLWQMMPPDVLQALLPSPRSGVDVLHASLE